MKVHRTGRGLLGVLLLLAALSGCKASGKRTEQGGPASPGRPTSFDASAAPVDAASATLDAADAVARVDSPRPAAFVEFEAMLEGLEKQPPSPARSKATCALSGMDKRVVVFAPARVPRPAHVGEADWEQAAHALWDTDIDIGEMCEDMDGKPEGGEDEEVLRLLRQRYERLVELTRTP